MNNPIPTYHDISKCLTSINMGVEALMNGENQQIYPVSINKLKATISIGEPIVPNIHREWSSEKERIQNYLVSEVKFGYEKPQRVSKDADIDVGYKASSNF